MSPCENCGFSNEASVCKDCDWHTKYYIEIPRNATNGNVMKAIFPDISLADFGDMYNEKWEILHKGRKITKTWWEELYG